MNIFYDDLHECDLREDVDYFRKCGFLIQEPKMIKKADISALDKNLYQYLEDYKNMAFKFIDLPEEEVLMTLGEESFRCFGKFSAGYFLLNQDGAVYLLLNHYESQGDLSSWFDNDSGANNLALTRYQDQISQGLGLLFVNQSLEDFLESFSLFMMRVFQLKSKIKRLAIDFERQAVIFKKDIISFSPLALEDGSFWNHMVFHISENLGWLQLTPGVVPYLKTKKQKGI